MTSFFLAVVSKRGLCRYMMTAWVPFQNIPLSYSSVFSWVSLRWAIWARMIVATHFALKFDKGLQNCVNEIAALHWRHNDHDGVSNHQPHGCLLNCLFRRRSKKTSKLRVTGLCVGNSPGPVNSPHKGPVTRKMFPFDDVIMGTNAEYSMLLMGLDSLSGKSSYQQRSEYLKPRNVGRKLPNRPEILPVLR